METKIEDKLRQLVAEYGYAVLEDDRRCAALMMDYCGPPSRFLNVLTVALKTGMPRDLARVSGDEAAQQIAGWVVRLEEEYGLTAEMARWSVGVWSFALSPHTKTVVYAETQGIASPGTALILKSGPIAKAVRVALNGPADYRSLVDAIASVPPNSVIEVLPGTYRGDIVLEKPVQINGRGATGEVVVEGTGLRCICMRTDNAVVRGMTIRGRGRINATVECLQGQLLLENCQIFGELASDGCVVVKDRADPIVRRCRISGSGVSGILVHGHGRGTFEDCEICDNSHHGVVILEDGDPSFHRCRIHDSRQGGGVFVSKGGRGLFVDCDVFKTRQNGVAVREGGAPIMRRCKIYDSTDGSGIYVYEDGRGVFEECDIYRNKRRCISIAWGGDPDIRRCKLRHSFEGCGVLVGENGRGTFEDCDVFENKLSGVVIHKKGSPLFRRCQIHHSREGSGVFVYDHGRGAFVDCEIFSNELACVEVREAGDPFFRRCGIFKSRKGNGVYVHRDGRATFEGCRVYSNADHEWDTGACQVVRRA